MRRILLFIFPILIMVSAAFTLFGFFQVRFEEEKLTDDLKRKAKSIAESMELSVRHALATTDLRNANYLAEKFETRERLQGCAIYDREGNWKNSKNIGSIAIFFPYLTKKASF